jgi:hypothetical protein
MKSPVDALRERGVIKYKSTTRTQIAEIEQTRKEIAATRAELSRNEGARVAAQERCDWLAYVCRESAVEENRLLQKCTKLERLRMNHEEKIHQLEHRARGSRP